MDYSSKKSQKSGKLISFVPGRNKPFCVSVYANNRRRREFYATEAEAKRRAAQIIAEKRRLGLEAMFFLPEQRAEYHAARLMLENAGKADLSILDAVKAFLSAGTGGVPAAQQPASTETGMTYEKAFAEYLAVKKEAGRSARTIDDTKKRIGKFCRAFAASEMNALTQGDVERYCVRKEVSARTCRNEFTAILSFLRFCKRRGWISLDLEFERKAFLPRELVKQKTVFTLAQTQAFFDLLESTPQWAKHIPFFAVQFFCGIRRAEAERLRWEWIDFEKKQIHLPAEITKTGDEHILRAPMLPETVFAWAQRYRFGAQSGTLPHPSLKTRAKIAKKIKWVQNAARHTFCTMHVSLHGDPAKTAVLLRHRNQQRLWQNYFAKLVPEEEARAFFALAPKK